MKVIAQRDTNVVLYVFEDSQVITFTDGQMHLGDPVVDIVADCNLENCILYENISNVPADYQGWKYDFDGTTWTENEAFKNWAADDERIEE